MPADFFAAGEIQLFVKPRFYPNWLYLGTAVTSPRVRADLIYTPIDADRVSPGPYNRMLDTEQHVVSAVLNRINHRNWNRIKDVGRPTGIGENLVRNIVSGRWVIGENDFELHIRHSSTFLANGPARPEATPKGRVYYSSIVLQYEEDNPFRVQELGILLECNPFPSGGLLRLYTEADEEMPGVTTE